MILTVTANVAVDRTYVIDHLEVGAVHKVTRAHAQTGGKGVNVSRCLRSLGAQTLITGVIGRSALADATSDLAQSGIESKLFAIDGAPRQTVTVTAKDGSTTAFDEPGPTVTERDWDAFEAHTAELLDGISTLVIAGSLPPGAPDRALAGLCRQANRHGVQVILDARGAALRMALKERPLIVKLNRAELAQTLDRQVTTDSDVLSGAAELRALGAGSVVVTLGEHGAIGVNGDCWRVTHPPAAGNPIGAGDAFSAALARGLGSGRSFPELLREGAAAALASISTPTAGALDAADYEVALGAVQVDAMQEVER